MGFIMFALSLTICFEMVSQSDVLVISCDVIADTCVQDVANLYRMHDASLVVVYQKALAGDVIIPGTKAKKHHGS